MPSRGRKFITEFLLPSLNERRFGSRLMWLDVENKIFQMQWNHKSSSDWTTSDAAVFAAWDQRKGHYNPNDKEYYPKSKQRFRAALNKFIKLKHITELNSEDRYTKIYCIGDGKNIFNTLNIVDKSVKENDGKENKSQMEMKQNPEDLVIDPFWNANLLTDPQENCVILYLNQEIKKESIISEEQVLASEFSPKMPHFENRQNYINFLNSTNDIKKKFSANEVSNILKESDVRSLNDDDESLVPETIYEKDNNLKKVITIENDDFHDYLFRVMETSRQKKWSDNEFHGTDEELSFDLSVELI
ncbi:Interferon regulatory factor 3 like protein [Argiope bruennichi]|uniref:Interferon regulatory factor 3 like protein n=1 Tax=Argiope bruennichi TaxID=94029 RepID=A0A8T0EIN6_ARGBR|nr:Interferon regulatory factor 3 like protein [Argiope bruennichi]